LIAAFAEGLFIAFATMLQMRLEEIRYSR